MKTMPAGKFKAQCLAVIDEVQAKRQPVIVTKRGKPIAQMVPLPLEGEDPIFGFFKGRLNTPWNFDVVAPTQTDEETQAYLERELENLR